MKYNSGMTDFYTRRGDDGTSGLLGNQRVPKDHSRLEAVGTIDEANAAFGLARATCESTQTAEIILTIQRDLYALMSEVAATPKNTARFRKINTERVLWLEAQIENISKNVEMPKAFIVPGDSLPGAHIDHARTITRRAERRVAKLVREGQLENRELIRYLNRLSSLCFILELFENQASSPSPVTLARGERSRRKKKKNK